MKIISTLSAITLIGLPMLSMAQDTDSDPDATPRIYLGGNYGYVKVKDADDFDDDNDALQGIVGVQFNRFVAIEGSYIDFGSYGNSVAKASTDGMTLALKGILPLTDIFSLYAKGGQLWWDSDYKVLGLKGDSDGTELFYGVGVGFALTDHLDLNVEYMRYTVDLDEDEVGPFADISDEQDLDHASVGLLFKF